MPESFPEIMTIHETAAYLRIPLRSMYKLAQEGKIPCQKVGRHWRFRRHALDHWLDSGFMSGESESRVEKLPRLDNSPEA